MSRSGGRLSSNSPRARGLRTGSDKAGALLVEWIRSDFLFVLVVSVTQIHLEVEFEVEIEVEVEVGGIGEKSDGR